VKVVHVVAAVIERGGRYLITRRLAGTHLGGLWEFPGGKILPGEKPEAALERELMEELGVRVTVGLLIESIGWAYPEKNVRLDFFRCAIDDDPHALQGQEMRWVAGVDLSAYTFPEADAKLVERLSRPPV
jgi:mutator protein MutT